MKKLCNLMLLFLLTIQLLSPVIINAETISENNQLLKVDVDSNNEVENKQIVDDTEKRIDAEVKEEADAKAAEEADEKAKEETDAKAVEEADAKAAEEADAKAKAKEEADAKAKEEADTKTAEEADAKATEEAKEKENNDDLKNLKLENKSGGIKAPLDESGNTGGFDQDDTDNVVRSWDDGKLSLSFNTSTTDDYHIHGSLHETGTYDVDAGHGTVTKDNYNEKYQFKKENVDEISKANGTFDKTIPGTLGMVKFSVTYSIYNMYNNDNVEYTFEVMNTNTNQKEVITTDPAVKAALPNATLIADQTMVISAGTFVDAGIYRNLSSINQKNSKGENGNILRVNTGISVVGPQGKTKVGSQPFDPTKKVGITYDFSRTAEDCKYSDDGGEYEFYDAKLNEHVPSLLGKINEDELSNGLKSYVSADNTIDPLATGHSKAVFDSGDMSVNQSEAGAPITVSFKNFENTQHIAANLVYHANKDWFAAGNLYVWVPNIPSQGTCKPQQDTIGMKIDSIDGTSIDGSPVNISGGDDEDDRNNEVADQVPNGDEKGPGKSEILRVYADKRFNNDGKQINYSKANGLGGSYNPDDGLYNAPLGTKTTLTVNSEVLNNSYAGGGTYTMKWDNRYINYVPYTSGDKVLTNKVDGAGDIKKTNYDEIWFAYANDKNWSDWGTMYHDLGANDPNTAVEWTNEYRPGQEDKMIGISVKFDEELDRDSKYQMQAHFQITDQMPENKVLPFYGSVEYYDENNEVERTVPNDSTPTFELSKYKNDIKNGGNTRIKTGGQSIYVKQATTTTIINGFKINSDGTTGEAYKNTIDIDKNSKMRISVDNSYLSDVGATDDITINVKIPTNLLVDLDTVTVDGKNLKQGQTTTYKGIDGKEHQISFTVEETEQNTKLVFNLPNAVSTDFEDDDNALPTLTVDAMLLPKSLNEKFTIRSEIDGALTDGVFDKSTINKFDDQTYDVVGTERITALKEAQPQEYTDRLGGKITYELTALSTADLDGEDMAMYDALPTNGLSGSSFSGTYKVGNFEMDEAREVTGIYYTQDKSITSDSTLSEILDPSIKWEEYSSGEVEATALKFDIGEFETGFADLKFDLIPEGNKENDVYTNNYVMSDTDGEAYDDSNMVETNIIGKAKIGLLKTDKDGHPLANAEFSIKKDGAEVEKIITDKFGKAVTSDLEFGEYEVSETKAPIGYKLSSPAYNETVTLNKDGEIVDLNEGNGIINERDIIFPTPPVVQKTGQVELLKVNHNQEPLSGAEFTITRNGKEVETITTDETGRAKSSKLAYGDYEVTETKAPENYKLSNPAYNEKITIDTDGQIINLNGGDGIINERDLIKPVPPVTQMTGEIRLLKVDENQNPLPGAEFTITRNEKEVETIITDETGRAKSSKLALGNYKITESKAPVGYKISNPVFTEEVKIEEDGQLVELNDGEGIVNQKINQPLPWTDVDPAKETIPWTDIDPAEKTSPWTDIEPAEKITPWTDIDPAEETTSWTKIEPAEKVDSGLDDDVNEEETTVMMKIKEIYNTGKEYSIMTGIIVTIAVIITLIIRKKVK